MRKIDFSICLMILVTALLMGTGSAQSSTGTTQVAAQFVSYITVVAPLGISDWVLNVGANTNPGTPTATIMSNYDGDVDLRIRDARTGFVAPMVAGKMTSDPAPSAAAYQLQNPIQVGATSTVGLSGTAATIYTLNAPGREQPPVTFNQQVEYTDYAASYYMTITFVGTVSV
jgi:hypothetical protein